MFNLVSHSKKTALSLSWILILGGILPLLMLYGLPQIGITQTLQVFNPNTFLKITVGIWFLFFCFIVAKHLQQKGSFSLTILIAIFWPYLSGFYHLVGHLYGVYPPVRPLMLVIAIPPTIYFLLRYWKSYAIHLPFIKYLVFFLVIAITYFIFFNAHTSYMGMAGSGSLTEGDISVSALYAYFWPLSASSVLAGTFFSLKPENRMQAFNRFNQILLWLSLAISMYSIVGYPFHWTSAMLDGFLRAKGIFFHPNSYSHHLGILMAYLTGMLFYYRTLGTNDVSKKLLYISYAVNLLAFILGFSKTAFFAFALAVCVLILTQLPNPRVRQVIFPILIFGALLTAAVLAGFSLITKQSFIAMLQSRVEDTSSLAFRQQLWGMLLPDIDWRSIWLGHGLSSANGALQHQMFYGHRQNAVIDVHNGYLELIYNMGLLGFTFVMACFSILFNSFKLMRGPITVFSLPLLGTAICVCVYYLIALGCDELLAFYSGSNLAFALITVSLCNVHILKLRGLV